MRTIPVNKVETFEFMLSVNGLGIPGKGNPGSAAMKIYIQKVGGNWFGGATFSSGTPVALDMAPAENTNTPGLYVYTGLPTAQMTVGDRYNVRYYSADATYPIDQGELVGVEYAQANTVQVNGTAQTARDLGASVLISSGTGTGQLSVTAGVIAANTTQVNGTAQTARDLGASVLISSGTGTGQLSVTSGVIAANTTQITGVAVATHTAGMLPSDVRNVDGVALATHTAGMFPDDIRNVVGDAATATNLKNQFDGSTGVTGSTFPSRQDQLTNLVITGSATNKEASTWTSLVANTVETGGVANTIARDAAYDVLTNTVSPGDSYYEFDVGSKGVPSGASIYAAVQNGSKTVNVYGYNWLGTVWVQIGTMNGTAGLTLTQYNFAMFTSMAGTGANLGKVRLRFLASATSTTITIEQMYVAYSTVNQSVGYANGQIWVDTVNGTAGTTAFFNGVADKPSLTWADALTLSASVGLKRFLIANGSTIQFPSDLINCSVDGSGWTLTGPVSRDISGTTIKGCENFTGLFSMPSHEAFLYDCQIGACTLGEADIHTSHITGLITLNQNAYFLIHRSVFVNLGGTAGIDFNSTSDARTCAIAKASGKLTVKNMKAGNILDIDGDCDLTLDAGCTAGTVYINGNIKLTNLGSGQTIIDTSRYGEDQNVTNVTGSVAGAVASVTAPVTLAADQAVNVTKVNGTLQTARDLGASVLISSGTGTGQLSVTSGVIAANATQIAGAAVNTAAAQLGVNAVNWANQAIPTPNATGIPRVDTTHIFGSVLSQVNNLAAGFKKWFDVAAPVGTVNSIPNATAGAAGGLAIVGSNMGTATSVTGNVGGNVVGNVNGTVASVTGNVGGNVVGNVNGNLLGTVATVTNLTNAPTNGDFTLNMKNSITTAATAATPSVTVSDKTGFSLSTAGILAIWSQATAALTGVTDSVGQKLATWVLGSDYKVLLSNNAQTGVTIPTVTNVGTVTGNVNGSVNSVTTNVNINSNADITNILLIVTLIQKYRKNKQKFVVETGVTYLVVYETGDINDTNIILKQPFYTYSMGNVGSMVNSVAPTNRGEAI